MDRPALTLLIQAKLADGRLPHNHIPRMWGGPGNGETCDGCGETVSKSQMVMEGLSVTDAAHADGIGVQFHVECFQVWVGERQVLGHDPSQPA
jgi:hypothetical protein